jgi:hypothetical protein
MPPLPRQNKSKEADFGLIFRKWWEKNLLGGEFELKDTRGKPNFAFSDVSDDQMTIATLAVGNKGVLVRRTAGTIGGADYSGLVRSPYWLVIRFPKGWCIISFETFALERSRSKRKSLTWERAQEIATIVV